jgi:hypothetical protein
MAATTMLALAAGTQAMSSAGAAYSGAKAIKAQGDYESQQHQTNAQLAEIQAEDATRRGEKDAQAINKKVRSTIGAQRVAAAAQGLDPNEGMALDAQAESVELGALEAEAIRNNAWRESFGHKTEAQNSRGKSSFTKLAADNKARNTLITGGLQFFSHAAQAGGYAAKGANSTKLTESQLVERNKQSARDYWGKK